MILDLQSFVHDEQPYWDELEALLNTPALAPGGEVFQASSTRRVRRLYYLYRRAASDLAKVKTFAAEPAIQSYLEDLVARAYTEVHGVREKPYRLRPGEWVTETFPRTFRRHYAAFFVVTGAMLAGSIFGAFAVMLDTDAKILLLPFEHLQGDPSERVAEEEARTGGEERRAGHTTFAAMLMSNNIRVSILAMALGLTWGLGTLIMVFYNGAILGAVAFDYIRAGESVFLTGWLLPHGAVEIPAILLAGQAGLVLGHALLGWNTQRTLRERLRVVAPDVVTLIFGVALLLVWAGFVESFFSQYHEPLVPYEAKILFGVVELVALFSYLAYAGRRMRAEDTVHG